MKRNVKEVILRHNGFEFNVTLYERSWFGWSWQRRLKIVCLNPPEGCSGMIYNGTCLIYDDTYPVCDTWWNRMKDAETEIALWCKYAQNLKDEEEAFKEAQRTGGIF